MVACYHIFEIRGQNFIFDTDNFEFLEITASDAYVYTDLLNKDDKFDCIHSKYKDIISKFAQEDTYFHYNNIKYPKNQSLYMNFSFPPIHKCNLCCRYCFANAGTNYTGSHKQFSVKQIAQLCDFLEREFFYNNPQFRLDFVSGGEPLLEPELTIRAIEQIKQYFEKKKRGLFIWLCSNAAEIEIDTVRKLDKFNVSLGISIDGDKDIHDFHRIYQDGRGSYDDVISNIYKIRKDSYLHQKIKDIWALVTITNKTESLVKILKHHKQLGFKSVQMKIARLPVNHNLAVRSDKELHKIKIMISELFIFFRECISSGSTAEIEMILNDNDFIGRILLRLILQRPVTIRCHAGISKISIEANGDIYPCDSFVGIDEFKMGSLLEGIKEKERIRWNNVDVYSRKKCSACWMKYVCGGDCMYNSYLVNGDILEPDEIVCNLNEYIIKEGIYFLSFFDVQYAAVYNSLVKKIMIKERIINGIY